MDNISLRATFHNFPLKASHKEVSEEKWHLLHHVKEVGCWIQMWQRETAHWRYTEGLIWSATPLWKRADVVGAVKSVFGTSVLNTCQVTLWLVPVQQKPLSQIKNPYIFLLELHIWRQMSESFSLDFILPAPSSSVCMMFDRAHVWEHQLTLSKRVGMSMFHSAAGHGANMLQLSFTSRV